MYTAKFDAFLFDQISLIKFCKNKRCSISSINLIKKSQSKLKSPRVKEKITKIKLQMNENEKSFCVNNNSRLQINLKILWDNQNYMPPILVPSSAKCIATQILVFPNLNGKKDFTLRVFVGDIIHPSKELPVQS